MYRSWWVEGNFCSSEKERKNVNPEKFVEPYRNNTWNFISWCYCSLPPSFLPISATFCTFHSAALLAVLWMLKSHAIQARAMVHFDFQRDVQTQSGQWTLISLEPDSISYIPKDGLGKRRGLIQILLKHNFIFIKVHNFFSHFVFRDSNPALFLTPLGL